MAIGTLSIQVIANTARASKNVTKFKKDLSGVQEITGRVSVGLKSLAAGILSIGAATQAISGIREAFGRLDDLAKTSSKLGIASQQLAGLRFAAEQTGVSAGTLDMALQRLVRRIGQVAETGQGEAKVALDALGLSAKELARLGPDEVFRRVAEAMSGVETQAAKLFLTQKLVDSEGVALVNTFNAGRIGLDRYQQTAERLGIAVEEKLLGKIENTNDALNRMDHAFQGIANTLAVHLTGPIETLAGLLEKVAANGDFIFDLAKAFHIPLDVAVGGRGSRPLPVGASGNQVYDVRGRNQDLLALLPHPSQVEEQQKRQTRLQEQIADATAATARALNNTDEASIPE